MKGYLHAAPCRYFERNLKQLFAPNDTSLLVEMERIAARKRSSDPGGWRMDELESARPADRDGLDNDEGACTI